MKICQTPVRQWMEKENLCIEKLKLAYVFASGGLLELLYSQCNGEPFITGVILVNSCPQLMVSLNPHHMTAFQY
jgi:hypothetical protein